MKNNFATLMLFICLTGFTSLASAQTAQENVMVNGKSFVKIWSSDRSSYLLKPSDESESTQKTTVTPESHLHTTGSNAVSTSASTKAQKNGTEAASQKPTPVMVRPMVQESSTPKH